LLVVNETAVLESVILILAAKLCDVPPERLREIKKASIERIEAAKRRGKSGDKLKPKTEKTALGGRVGRTPI